MKVLILTKIVLSEIDKSLIISPYSVNRNSPMVLSAKPIDIVFEVLYKEMENPNEKIPRIMEAGNFFSLIENFNPTRLIIRSRIRSNPIKFSFIKCINILSQRVK